jgi:hypothetical protein
MPLMGHSDGQDPRRMGSQPIPSLSWSRPWGSGGRTVNRRSLVIAHP